jgi:hypothetical protein
MPTIVSPDWRPVTGTVVVEPRTAESNRVMLVPFVVNNCSALAFVGSKEAPLHRRNEANTNEDVRM